MSTVDAPLEPERLRMPPSERFAGESHQFDLRQALAQLRAEDHPARDGHRQVTIFHHTPVTHVLFDFEAGGVLPEHSTRGLVTIHVLEGRFMIRTDAGSHRDLRAGALLILNPELPHAVQAVERSAMLLTVHLDAPR